MTACTIHCLPSAIKTKYPHVKDHYYSLILSRWVYCAMHTAFTLLSLLFDFALQGVDFLFCWVRCHILVVLLVNTLILV